MSAPTSSSAVTPEPTDRPRRVRVTIPVTLEIAPECRVKAIIDDISKDGFRLRSRAALVAGQPVTLHLPRESLAGELRWVDGKKAGGIFTEATPLPSW